MCKQPRICVKPRKLLFGSRRCGLDAALTLPAHAPAVAGTGDFSEVSAVGGLAGPIGGFATYDTVVGGLTATTGGWTMALAESAFGAWNRAAGEIDFAEPLLAFDSRG